jgi:DNA-binding transcriptional regulator YiaG
MTPAEIKATRERLGLSHAQAARLVGVLPRSWKRWETASTQSARDMPIPVQRLLRLAEAIPDARKLLDLIATP